jgi:hypothetical protein
MPEWSTSLSSDFNLGTGADAYMATIIFGAALIVAMLAAPNGIQGGLRWVWGYGRTWVKERRRPAARVASAAGD